MKPVYQFLKNTVTGGLFFLIPAFVVILIVSKIWTFMKTFGDRSTEILGVHATWLGIGTGSLATGLLLLAICFGSGLLLQIAFMGRVRNWIDRQLVRYLPGYDFYKQTIEQKLHRAGFSDVRIPVLVTMDGVGQPGFIVEELADKRLVVFISSKPGAADGHVYVVHPSAIERMDTDESTLTNVLRQHGKGLATLIMTKQLLTGTQ